MGNELVLNCRLTASYSGPLNASHLFFDNVIEHRQAVEHVVNNRTRQLRIPGMQMSDEGTYICYLNETLVGGKEKSLASAGFSKVHVGGTALYYLIVMIFTVIKNMALVKVVLGCQI